MINDNGEIVVECPYDSGHIIVEKFLSKHLIKCRRNHPSQKKVACKFNKNHLIPKPEMPHHLKECPNRNLIDRELQSKASAGVDGVHCGDLKGPKIITNYHDDDDDEWGSEPVSAAPKGMFNWREMDNTESESDKPRTIPGANYPSRFPRNAAAASGEDAYGKFPMAPSEVAQRAEMSKIGPQPHSSSQVYQNPLTQTYSNPGFGRGQGIHQQQAVQTVGLPRSCLPDPVVSVSADISRPVNMPQPLKFERFPLGQNQFRGQNQFHGQTSEVNNSHSATTLDSMRPQLNGLYNQQHKENLAQGNRASRGEFENNKVESHTPEIFSTTGQPMTMSRDQDQTDVPLLPKGRGCLRGIEQLRRPASFSLAQGSNYNNLLDPHRMEAHSGRDVSNGQSEQNSSHDKDNNFSDAGNATINSDDLQKAERKLRKKLKQLNMLEQKSAAGMLLNEEEICKLEKKDEIVSLIESISKLL